MTEELIAFESKDEMLEKSRELWNPGKTQFWIDSGVPLVIGRRDGYFIAPSSRRRIVSIAKAYHGHTGHTGLAVAAGDERFATLFLAGRPRSSPTSRSTTWPPGRTRCAATTWRPCSWRLSRPGTSSSAVIKAARGAGGPAAATAVPAVEPGILFIERQSGVLEIHSPGAER